MTAGWKWPRPRSRSRPRRQKSRNGPSSSVPRGFMPGRRTMSEARVPNALISFGVFGIMSLNRSPSMQTSFVLLATLCFLSALERQGWPDGRELDQGVGTPYQGEVEINVDKPGNVLIVCGNDRATDTGNRCHLCSCGGRSRQDREQLERAVRMFKTAARPYMEHPLTG